VLVFASIPNNYRKTRAFPSPSCGGAVFVLERQNVGKPAEIRAFLASAWPSTTRHKTRTTPSQTRSAGPEKGTAQHLVLPAVTGTDVGAPSVPNSWVRTAVRPLAFAVRGYAPICQLARKLIRAGIEPDRPLEAYRNGTLALRVTSLAAAARLNGLRR
jgi:hypothetical protein